MINGQIRDKEVRVIGQDGEQIGIMSPREAMKLAEGTAAGMQDHRLRQVQIRTCQKRKGSQEKTEDG